MTSESAELIRSVGCQKYNRNVMEMSSMVSTKRDRSESDAKEFRSLPSIIDTDLNQSASCVRETDSSTPIHLMRRTKSFVSEDGGERTIRQRPPKDSYVLGAIDAQLPARESRDATNKPSYQLSLACKRLSRLIVYISIYIVFFSSSGINVHLLWENKELNAKNQPGPRDYKLSQKRRSHMTLSPKQTPVPDFEFESSSTDDGEDDSGDDPSDNDGGAEKSTIAGHRFDGGIQNSILREGNGGAKKKLRPTMAHAKSVFSSQVQGAPKPKQDRDAALYSYRDVINDVTILRIHNSKVYEDINVQMKKGPTLAQHKGYLNNMRVSDKNDSILSYNETYQNVVILYGDSTNQITLCLAWFFLVVFMMDAGVRNIKRYYR